MSKKAQFRRFLIINFCISANLCIINLTATVTKHRYTTEEALIQLQEISSNFSGDYINDKDG